MIIRPVANNLHKTGTAITPITVTTPGGQYTWKLIRVTNYSPYVCTLQHTSEESNTPPQTLAPYQQNIYQFSGLRTQIEASFAYVTTPGTFKHFLLVEYCDDHNGFPGRYPVALAGQSYAVITGAFVKSIAAGTHGNATVTITPITGRGNVIITVTATGGGGGPFIPLAQKGVNTGVPKINATGSIVQPATQGTNLAVGKDALLNDVSGQSNTAIGSFALQANTTGQDNTALGDGALAANVSGNANIGIGYHALSTLITGNGNIGIGTSVGFTLDGGNNNIVIGTDAGDTIVSTSNSVVIGNAANANSSNTIAVGHTANALNITAIAIGHGSHSSNANAIAIGTTAKGLGQLGIAIGKTATVTQTYSIAIGATSKTETATTAIAIGHAANIGITATSSIAIGVTAKVNPTRPNSIAIGKAAVAQSVRSIAIGSTAIVTTTGGSTGAIAIGNSALARKIGSIAIGENSSSQHPRSLSIGINAHAHGTMSVAIGPTSQATTANEFTLGNATNRYNTPGKFINLATKVTTNPVAITYTTVTTAGTKIATYQNTTGRTIVVYIRLTAPLTHTQPFTGSIQNSYQATPTLMPEIFQLSIAALVLGGSIPHCYTVEMPSTWYLRIKRNNGGAMTLYRQYV